jgi:MFS family permease
MPSATPYGVVWALIVFAWVANYLVRMGFSALLPAIIAELALSYTAAGLLASAFFAAYAAAQFPAGVLGDRLGHRRMVLLALVVGAAGALATGLAASFPMLLGARVLTGLGQGGIFSNDRPIIAAVTPPARVGLGQAVSFSGVGIGITAGLLLAGFLGEHMSWRAVFALFAAPPLLAALLIRRFVPEPRVPGARAGRGIAATAAEPGLWLLAVVGAAGMWVQYVLATWAPLLFMEAGVEELGRAGSYSSVIGVAGVGGLVLGGWLSDRARRAGRPRRTVVAGGLATVALAMVVLALVVDHAPSAPAVGAGVVLAGLATWAVWGPSFAMLGEMFDERELSTAFGLYNTVCVLGAVVGPGLTGWTRDLTGSFAAGCYVSAAVALAGGLLARRIGERARSG